ncbi:MAG: 16S rRNA (adenine(1518)-N(6)/adenine(1519)-N(6))-dimethyltransferase RsmA [Candidatus Hodarchaeota archaeon]
MAGNNLQERIELARSLLPCDPDQITKSQLLQFTKNILLAYGYRPWRRKGQHFLVNPEVLKFLLFNANLKSDEIILEIGGGIGTLSLFLASKAKKLIIIENDYHLIDVLSILLSDFSNVVILPGDACKIEWPPFDKLVSNLPYQISSPITMKLTREKFCEAIITYQLEFAQRLLASAGDREYSRISVQSSLYFKTKMLQKIGREAFFPSPKVTSAIVKITPRKNIPKIDLDVFERFLALLFSRKNKKVMNNLIPYFKRHGDYISHLVEKVLYLLTMQDKRPLRLFSHEILLLFNNLNTSFQSHGISFPKILQSYEEKF